MQPKDVVDFWTRAGSKRWFKRDSDFDEAIRARFERLHHRAARRELVDWADSADGALALLLLLDQFPRNLFRGSAHAFATDALARRIADAAVHAGFDQASEPILRPFFYMPFEHSEAAADQARAIDLLTSLAEAGGDADYLRWARVHADIIDRFGRFPHRNACLGRQSTPEEVEFLNSGGFAG